MWEELPDSLDYTWYVFQDIYDDVHDITIKFRLSYYRKKEVVMQVKRRLGIGE